MSMKHIFKEFISQPKFFIFFVLNLTLGLVGFISLDAFKESFQGSLMENSRSLLGADLSISARRDLTPDEELLVKNELSAYQTESNKKISIYSMVKSENNTRLAQVQGIEDSFPYYGHIGLENLGKMTGNTPKNINIKPVAWIYPELQTQLGVKIGSTIKIGTKEFMVEDIISDDAGASSAGAAMAPKIYIGLNFLKNTDLLQKGSTLWSSRLIKFNQNIELPTIEKKLNLLLTDPGIRVQSHKSSGEQTGRILNYLNDYLGLVSLAALFLSGIGAAYLYRSYLSHNLKNFAIYLSLGATHKSAFRHNISLLITLGMTAGIFSILITSLLLPILPIIVKSFLPVEVNAYISLRSIIVALCISILGSLFICLPMLAKIKELKPNQLFQESAIPHLKVTKKDFFYVIPALISYWLLAIWQANSLLVGSSFVIGFLLSSLILGILAFACIKILQNLLGNQKIYISLALKYLTRNKANTLACFLALGLGTLLINLIPQIKSSLESEISKPDGGKLPSLFFFDIQDEQSIPFTHLLEQEKTQINQLSPMIRARLMSINGVEFKKPLEEKELETREQDRANQQRNRTYNLSYREKLSDSEVIVKGMPFSGIYKNEGTPEISLEERFADRIGAKIDDTMEFEVLGVNFTGKVVNFRKVRWADFQPNFFILFQAGVLDDAPKTFIASAPPMNIEQKTSIQNKIVDAFPNISIIDVSRLITKIIETIGNMEAVLKYMAWLSLLVGFIVLYSIANHQANLKRKDIALLKVLGAQFNLIKKTTYVEFFAISFISSSLGAMISIAFGWILTFFIFDGVWKLEWQLPLFTIFGVVVMSLVTSYIATVKSLRIKPVSFLK